MKNLIWTALATTMISGAIGITADGFTGDSETSGTIEIQCSGKFDGKIESFKARIRFDKLGDNLKEARMVFWSKNKMIQADAKSFFASLSDMENFGLEGTGSFIAKNNFKVLSVINTAEEITIGVSPDLTRGFYNYRDGGSGLGNQRTPLICKRLLKALPI
jgi:hypothetical protein